MNQGVLTDRNDMVNQVAILGLFAEDPTVSASDKGSPAPWTYSMEVSPTGQPQPSPVSVPIPADQMSLLQLMVQLQSNTNDMLRQLLEMNRQSLDCAREATQAAREQRARQSQELERWQNSHQSILFDTRGVLQSLEQVHGQIIEQLVNHVHEHQTDLMEGDFALGDFTDRYGPRLAHLNTILSILRPLAALAQHQQAEARNKPQEG
ncbi:MAG: hypothetical protein WCJ40_03735 [Planctomycetota bacterium]|nr:hypothetical protein [Planctomycetota bacterium]